MTSSTRNFVLFKTDLFLLQQRDQDIDAWFVGGDCAGWFYMRLLAMDHIERHCEPVMEDWGWTFAVSVDSVVVWVQVWEYLHMGNCWLFGLEPKRGWFQRHSAEKLAAARDVVASALDALLASDTRIAKHAWYADNPFDLKVEHF